MTPINKETCDRLGAQLIAWDADLKTHVAPKQFEHRLTIRGYLPFTPHEALEIPPIMDFVFDAASRIGTKHIYYLPLERLEGEKIEEIAMLVSLDELDSLKAHHEKRWGCEFNLIDEDMKWMAWGFHEPCVHLAGSAEFIDAFKQSYPERQQCKDWDDCAWDD